MSNLPSLSVNPPDTPQNICRAVNNLLSGKINSAGFVTLTQNGTQTTLYDNHANPQAVYHFTPTTADAASVTGLWYDPTSIPLTTAGGTGGKVTLNHSAVNKDDLTFAYVSFT